MADSNPTSLLAAPLLENALLWLDVFTIDLARYLLGAGTVSFVLYITLRSFSESRRIQARRASYSDICREIGNSVITVAVYASVALFTVGLINSGNSMMYSELRSFDVAYIPFSIVLLLVFHDAYFYWAHRLMHSRRLFRLFHRTHHMSRTPTPWAAYCFAIPEAFLMACFVPLVIQLLPVHSIALFTFLIIMIFRNAMGHSGIEFHPPGWVDSRWDFLTTVTHHDLHHQKFDGNYGLYFTWWDRWMGTERPEYKSTFRKVTNRDSLTSEAGSISMETGS
ncbi:MAG: sterol desaturase family protein [Gammaproteobacteria bacterium]